MLLLDLLFPPRKSQLLVRNTAYLTPRPWVTEKGAVVLFPRADEVARAAVKESLLGNARAINLLGDALTQYLKEELADRCLYEERTYELVPLPGAERLVAYTARELDFPEPTADRIYIAIRARDIPCNDEIAFM